MTVRGPFVGFYDVRVGDHVIASTRSKEEAEDMAEQLRECLSALWPSSASPEDRSRSAALEDAAAVCEREAEHVVRALSGDEITIVAQALRHAALSIRELTSRREDD